GISVVTYEDEKGEIVQTVILGEGNKPINLNDRVLRWQKDIETAATKYKLHPALIAAVMEQESGGDPNSLSPTGAIGLMQLMPETARSLGVNPYDPTQNIDGGAHYLQQQLASFGNEEAALAAYNAGPGNVQSQRWLNFSETRDYVQRVPRLEDKYKRIWQENEFKMP
ncbi:MAG: lytic transglycosylase domain-containing protein, partial [Desulfitobacteriaceae bacterium]